MKRKNFSKLLATVVSLALLFTSLVPLSTALAEITPFTTDTFDDQIYSNETWVTDKLNTPVTINAYSYGDNGTEKFLKPAWHTTANSAFTMVNSTIWPTDRIKEVETRVKINNTTRGSTPTYYTNLTYYYDPDTKSYATLQLGIGNNTTTNSPLAFSNSIGMCTTTGISGGSTTTLADVAANNANQWVTVNFVYDYTNFNAANRQLKVTFQIKLQDNTVVATGQLRTVSLTTNASQKVFFAIGNDTASGNSSIDYVRVVQTEAVTDSQLVSMFQTKYATLLAKAVNDVTIANDDSTISEALVTYGSLSTSVKALLTAENTKLTSMKSYLKSTVLALTEDTFSDSAYTNSAWTTEKAQSGLIVNPNFTPNNNGTDYYLTPAISSSVYSAAVLTRPRDAYTSNGNLKKVTVRLKSGGAGWYGGGFMWYYDPVTKLSAGIDIKTIAYNSINYLAYRPTSTPYLVAQAGVPTVNTSVLNNSNLLQSDWLTVEATYDFSSFNAATRQLKVSVVIKKDDGSYTASAYIATITLPQGASQNVSFAIVSANSAANSPVYDYAKVEYALTQAEEDQIAANAFKAKYATTLAKNVGDVTIADDGVNVSQALNEYATLTVGAKAFLTADGTYTKLADINSLLTANIPTFTGDSFDNQFLSNNYWKTELLKDTLNSGYTYSTVDSNTCMKLPIVSGGTSNIGDSSITTIDSQYVANSNPNSVSIKLKLDPLNYYQDGILYFYYDPVNKYRAGVDYHMGDGISTSAMIRPYLGTVVSKSGSQSAFGLQTGGWYTITATYDYTNFNSATRVLGIKYTILDANNTPILSNLSFLYTLPADASDKVSFAFGNDVGSNKTTIDSISISAAANYTVTSADVTKNPVITGTSIETALGSTVSVSNTSGTAREIAVTWNTGEYDADVPGTYTVHGTLATSGTNSLATFNLVNTNNIQAVATIDVKAFIINNYTISGTTLKNITPSSDWTEANFLTNILVGSGTTTAFSNQAVTGKVGTGTTLQLTNGASTTYTVLIYGDITGDGSIGAGDLIAVKKNVLKLQVLTGMQLAAGDTTRNGSITISDLIAIKKSILGLQTIAQS